MRRREDLSARRTRSWIWVAAVLFRLTVLPLDPSLSEDSVRYRWQGMMQNAGGDPYLATPREARWVGLRDATWPRVAGKDMTSAYGPVLEQLNLWCYRLSNRLAADPWAQVWLFKLPYALADLGVGLALMWLLSGMGLPQTWAAVYLWSPLAVTEFWIEGHNDAVAVAFALAALALAVRERRTWALAALAAAVICKFWPVVLLPFLAVRRSGGRWKVEWRGLLVAAAVACVLCWPYRSSIFAVRDVLLGFAGGWRNNDSLFAVILHLAGGDMNVAAQVAKGALLLAVVGLRLKVAGPVAGGLAAICALLLLAPNCFPWYLTWMLPLLAVHPLPPLLLWTVLAPLAYHVVPAYEAAGIWEYDAALTTMEYVPVLGWLACSAAGLMLRRGRKG